MHFDAIVVPLGAEAQAVKRGWYGVSPPLVMVPAGAAAGAAVRVGPSHATALVIGLCGALDPALAVGQTVVYGEIAEGSVRIDLDPQLAQACAQRLGVAVYRAANVATVVAEPAAKTALRVESGAAVIDMEAASLARALHANGVRVAMVRVVSDDARSTLPDLRDVYDPAGTLRPLALTLAFARHPMRSVRFIRNVLTALRALYAAARQLST